MIYAVLIGLFNLTPNTNVLVLLLSKKQFCVKEVSVILYISIQAVDVEYVYLIKKEHLGKEVNGIIFSNYLH